MSIKCAFLFPGQGSQSVGMGQDFFNNSAVAKQLFIDASVGTGIDFSALLFEENHMLGQTEYTQPAILLVGAIAHKLFTDETGIKPVLTMGHSLGEFTALVAAGALDALDAVKLVNLRGQLMAEACSKQEVGMMVSLGLSDEAVENLCAEQRDAGLQVWAVNYNADGQIVIAGIKKDLELLAPMAKEAGAKRAMLLDMSVASHCPLLESASAPLEAKLKEMLKDEFIAPVISNVTAEPYNTKAEALDLLPQQLVKPVLYKHSMANIDDQVDCYIEFGNGNVLKGLNRKATKKPHFNVSDMASLEATIAAIKELLMSKIAIMGAMPEEVEPIVKKLDNLKETLYGANTYYEGSYNGQEVVVAYSKIGKVFATLTATMLIEKFGCDTLLFSGVAGAISDELKIGDLIIADGLCQHDLDITAFGHPFGYVPEGEVCIPTDVNLRNIAKEVAASKGLMLKEGVIATGDQFVANAERKDWIGDIFKADALEMEGASVAVVCSALDIPFFILRAISDSADMDASFNFDAFLESSAKISADFILSMVDAMVDARQK